MLYKTGKDSIARRFYGNAKRHRLGLSRNEFLEIIEEIENEDIRGF